MKAILLVFGCICCTCSIFAQERASEKTQSLLLQDWRKRDKLPASGWNYTIPPQYNTPVITLPNPGQYVTINDKGDSVYVMTHDNMPCLSPDSKYTAQMPDAEEVKRELFGIKP